MEHPLEMRGRRRAVEVAEEQIRRRIRPRLGGNNGFRPFRWPERGEHREGVENARIASAPNVSQTQLPMLFSICSNLKPKNASL